MHAIIKLETSCAFKITCFNVFHSASHAVCIYDLLHSCTAFMMCSLIIHIHIKLTRDWQSLYDLFRVHTNATYLNKQREGFTWTTRRNCCLHLSFAQVQFLRSIRYIIVMHIWLKAPSISVIWVFCLFVAHTWAPRARNYHRQVVAFSVRSSTKVVCCGFVNTLAAAAAAAFFPFGTNFKLKLFFARTTRQFYITHYPFSRICERTRHSVEVLSHSFSIHLDYNTK